MATKNTSDRSRRRLQERERQHADLASDIETSAEGRELDTLAEHRAALAAAEELDRQRFLEGYEKLCAATGFHFEPEIRIRGGAPPVGFLDLVPNQR